ncbi:MAG: tRNA lysidine(34) synthetase TilS [Gammaproteobacteria bacterium]
MSFKPETLLAHLLQLPTPRRYCLAFSGGVDSHVLLHALVQIRDRLGCARLHAIHINHGIHPDAAQWARHCAIICQELDVSYETHSLELSRSAGNSLEALARDARYATFTRVMQADDMLLLAHHQDDQAETLLLQLLRGSGVKGLAAMPALTRFATGWLARPLLTQNREDLLGYAMAQQLPWIEDPSNQDTAFDRNFLRHAVLPLMRQRWPALNTALSRAAQHQAEAASLLDEQARQDLAAVANTHSPVLPVAVLTPLSPARQRNVLRYWLHRVCGLPLPSSVQLQRILDEILPAAADAMPLVHWPGAEVRRYRDALYAMPPATVVDSHWHRHWDLQVPLDLADGRQLQSRQRRGVGLSCSILEQGVSIRFRQGGERCRLPGHSHHHELKKLFQDWGVPPWCRERIPLVFVGEELVQVVGFGVCASYAAKADEMGIEISIDTGKSAIETTGENKDNSPGCTP